MEEHRWQAGGRRQLQAALSYSIAAARAFRVAQEQSSSRREEPEKQKCRRALSDKVRFSTEAQMVSIRDNIKPVAELVDDRAGWELLRSFECGLPRGFSVAQPMERASARWQATP